MSHFNINCINLDRENHIKVHYEKMQSSQKPQYGILINSNH